jgi:hypothetical protein
MHLAYWARTGATSRTMTSSPGLVNAHCRLTITLTCEGPSHWKGHRGRVGRTLLADAGWRPADAPLLRLWSHVLRRGGGRCPGRDGPPSAPDIWTRGGGPTSR